ncbi:hypothetical protein BDZ91DRAFT_313147 [Kalaharituber pfeilii]|nr:hypothetical protein BDZ91DRAFT_374431 [Kalaharituber pfeilii]KAF8463322.1 hypothetical protein BDZ91DRAFT_313147 [Kalaharituber pfeilii]
MASSAPNLPRDRDLPQCDDFLTDPMLDSLWDWFCTAMNKSTDPQLVFVKLINSVCASFLPFSGFGL